jgi:hypothetical protein
MNIRKEVNSNERVQTEGVGEQSGKENTRDIKKVIYNRRMGAIT